MGFFLWLIVGGISGWLAGKIMKGSGYGFFRNVLLGFVGGCLGGWVGRDVLGLEWASVDGFNLGSIATAVIGAVLFIYVVRLIREG